MHWQVDYHNCNCTWWWWAYCSLRFRCPYPTSACLNGSWRYSHVGALITWCGRAFQWLTTFVLKNVFRTVAEHLGKNSYRLCPHKLCKSVANWKNDWLSTRSFPVRILNVSIRSPRSLLCCSEYSPKDFSRSSYHMVSSSILWPDSLLFVELFPNIQYLFWSVTHSSRCCRGSPCWCQVGLVSFLLSTTWQSVD